MPGTISCQNFVTAVGLAVGRSRRPLVEGTMLWKRVGGAPSVYASAAGSLSTSGGLKFEGIHLGYRTEEGERLNCLCGVNTVLQSFFGKSHELGEAEPEETGKSADVLGYSGTTMNYLGSD